jgi:segregation and condensation protein A
LYLIKKEEIDICNIPIAKVTEQYLEYMEFMRLLDLNIAGEFLVMAATLMHIKSRMLLPPEEQPQEDAEEEDPRAELVRKLLEYKRFKEAASALSELEGEQKNRFSRVEGEKPGIADEEQFFEASLFDLINAFSKVLKEVPRQVFQEIIKDEFTVEEKVHQLLHLLMEQPVIYFSRLFEAAKSKGEIIATFLAVLELIRTKEIIVRQSIVFGEIEIVRNAIHIKADVTEEIAG